MEAAIKQETDIQVHSATGDKPSPDCQICKIQTKAEYICMTCNKKLICKKCADRHHVIKALASHQIVPLEERCESKHGCCDRHGDNLTYFCQTCRQALCMECVFQPEHGNHSDDIVTIQDGIKPIKDGFKKDMEQFNETCKEFEMGIQIVKQELGFVTFTQKQIETKCSNLKQKSNLLKNDYKTVSELVPNLKDCYSDLAKQKKIMEDLNIHIKCIDEIPYKDYVCFTKELQKKTQEQNDAAGILMDREIKTARYRPIVRTSEGDADVITKTKKIKSVINEKYLNELKRYVQETENDEKRKKQRNLMFDKPQLKLRIEEQNIIEVSLTRAEIKDPKELIGVDDGTVILVDSEFNYLQRIDISGNLVGKYVPNWSPGKLTACVYAATLFIGWGSNKITEFSLDTHEKINTYTLPMGYVEHISAGNDKTLFISEQGKESRIIQYNTETNTCTEKVRSIWKPGKVYVTKSKDYIVAYTHRKSKQRRVRIYDETWNPYSSYSIGMHDPKGMTLVDGYRVLIADSLKHKICIFTVGSHCSDEVNIEGVRSPIDVAYSSPHLWVLQSCSPYIQMFLWK